MPIFRDGLNADSGVIIIGQFLALRDVSSLVGFMRRNVYSGHILTSCRVDKHGINWHVCKWRREPVSIDDIVAVADMSNQMIKTAVKDTV